MSGVRVTIQLKTSTSFGLLLLLWCYFVDQIAFLDELQVILVVYDTVIHHAKLLNWLLFDKEFSYE